MSDFISRLIGRSFGLIPVARPLLPSLYAPDWSMPEPETASGLDALSEATVPLPATEPEPASRIASRTAPSEPRWSETGTDSALLPGVRPERTAPLAREDLNHEHVRAFDPIELEGTGRIGAPPPDGASVEGSSVMLPEAGDPSPRERLRTGAAAGAARAEIAEIAEIAERQGQQVSAHSRQDVRTQAPGAAAWPHTESELSSEPLAQDLISVSAEPLRSIGTYSNQEYIQSDSGITPPAQPESRRAAARTELDHDGASHSTVFVATPPPLGSSIAPEEPELLVRLSGAGLRAIDLVVPSGAELSTGANPAEPQRAAGAARFERSEIGLVPDRLSILHSGSRAEVAASASIPESIAAPEGGVTSAAAEPLLLPVSTLPLLAEPEALAARPHLDDNDVRAERAPLPSESVPAAAAPFAVNRSERAVQLAEQRTRGIGTASKTNFPATSDSSPRAGEVGWGLREQSAPSTLYSSIRPLDPLPLAGGGPLSDLDAEPRAIEATADDAAQSDPVHQALQLARLLPFHPERRDSVAAPLSVGKVPAAQAPPARPIADLQAPSPVPQQLLRSRSRSDAAEPIPAEMIAEMELGSARSQQRSIAVRGADAARAESVRARELTRGAAREGVPLLLPPLAGGEELSARSPDLLAAAARAQGPSSVHPVSAGVAAASGAPRSRAEAAFSAEEAPRIRVGIGRIEVHAAPPAAPPAPRLGAAAPASSSLDEYLRSLGGKIS